MKRRKAQLAVVGSGVAGLYTALCAAREGAAVLLVSATPLAGSSSYWAQGGLAAAIAQDDSAERHLADTIAAGRRSVRESAARVLCQEAPHAVADLASLGVRFDADRAGHPVLGLEGGHSARRIVHAGGAATGRRLIRQLSALVAEHPRIEVLERRRVVSVNVADGRCTGATLDGEEQVVAPAVVLATGGVAALWSRTTNPAGAVGGGLLLAYWAGAALADLELVQFHPTAVVAPHRKGVSAHADGFLVTEAIRGEGAVLVDGAGARFVDELAPRDEVARAVWRQMEMTQSECVYLDMRAVDPALFPNVVGALRRAGIDPEREPVPVAPAAHYMMGGIATDLDGRASVLGLYAVGECSCTGLHGANRLASNSLTECFVFGARAARAALHESLPVSARGDPSGADTEATFTPAAEELARAAALPADASRRALWRCAGIERTAEGLRTLAEDPHPLVRLIAVSGLLREESRGAHQRADFPELDPGLDGHHVVLRPGAEAGFEPWT